MLKHATRSHHLVPNCLGTEGIGNQKSSCALQIIQTKTCDINIAYMHVPVTPNQFNACYLERDWVRRCPGSHEETSTRPTESVHKERYLGSNESTSMLRLSYPKE